LQGRALPSGEREAVDSTCGAQLLAWVQAWVRGMNILSFIHDAIFPPSLQTEQRPLDNGETAWKAIQDKFRKEEEKVRAKHGPVKAVQARRSSWVHSALAGQSFIPSEGLSGAAADRGAV